MIIRFLALVVSQLYATVHLMAQMRFSPSNSHCEAAGGRSGIPRRTPEASSNSYFAPPVHDVSPEFQYGP